MQSITITSTNPDNGQERLDTISQTGTPEANRKRIAKRIAILKNKHQINIKVIK